MTPFNHYLVLRARFASSTSAGRTVSQWSGPQDVPEMVDASGQSWTAAALLAREWTHHPTSADYERVAVSLAELGTPWTDPHSLGWLLAATLRPGSSGMDGLAFLDPAWLALLESTWKTLPAHTAKLATDQALGHLEELWNDLSRSTNAYDMRRNWVVSTLGCALLGQRMPCLDDSSNWPQWVVDRAVEALGTATWLDLDNATVEALLAPAVAPGLPSPRWAPALAHAAARLTALAGPTPAPPKPGDPILPQVYATHRFLLAAAAIFADRALRIADPSRPLSPGMESMLVSTVKAVLDDNRPGPMFPAPHIQQAWGTFVARARACLLDCQLQAPSRPSPASPRM